MSRRDEAALARFLDVHQVGDELDGTVDSIVSFGAFIEFAEGVHGLLHESVYRDRLQLGSGVRVRIAAMDLEARRMSLLPV